MATYKRIYACTVCHPVWFPCLCVSTLWVIHQPDEFNLIPGVDNQRERERFVLCGMWGNVEARLWAGQFFWVVVAKFLRGHMYVRWVGVVSSNDKQKVYFKLNHSFMQRVSKGMCRWKWKKNIKVQSSGFINFFLSISDFVCEIIYEIN